MKKQLMSLSLGAIIAGSLGLGGCATSSSVDKKIAEAQAQTDTKIETVASQVENLQEQQKATEARVDQLSQTAQEALKRATEAGVLAKGKVVLEQTITDDNVKFNSDSYKLSADSKKALDELATKLKGLDSPYFVEIQGHTDSRASESYNDRLGSMRAEAVRRYLSKEANIPLVRMSTISYGESAPVASNKTRSGRAENRRVVLVVLE